MNELNVGPSLGNCSLDMNMSSKSNLATNCRTLTNHNTCTASTKTLWTQSRAQSGKQAGPAAAQQAGSASRRGWLVMSTKTWLKSKEKYGEVGGTAPHSPSFPGFTKTMEVGLPLRAGSVPA